MKTTKTVTKRTQIVDDVICNKCGESCKPEKDDFFYEEGSLDRFYGLIETEVAGHYYSPVLLDCTYYRFSVCEMCLSELFLSFKIPCERTKYL
jgi:hypothetical protein